MNLNMKGLKGMVTGGSRGIGKAVIENFIAENMQLATGARDEETLNSVAKNWVNSSYPVFVKPLDVTDETSYQEWFDASISALGGLDVLVSNVSTLTAASGEDRWASRVDVDLMQHIRLTEMALPYLKKSKNPSIVYVASIASVMANNSSTELEYGAIKAALTAYAMKMAHMLGQYGIRVNVVSPGPIVHKDGHWEMMKKDQPDIYNYVASLSLFNRLGTPLEVANAITFLSSPAASNITATNQRVDGGTVKTVNF
ncbi:SDR family NAD(P)-dependent oxidoreductase [Paraglaciecola arctica]|uniref:SDR family NAD(P)-dependent oxidoreductase n=1 Tax=Paraglaciecola arctica TaxID=1128911 RepID=UPI001C0678EF|nr:SDR family oxidoreductase [Paraglaciecola arctica]MBU3004520.1 SDR family oxidoreductase [Paraglaciecola arctica]